MDEINFRQEQQLGIVTLNRPQALNALNMPMIQALFTQLNHWKELPDIHAVVIHSSANKAFCAGGDVRWLYEAGKRDVSETMAFFEQEYQLNALIHQYPKPYIALMDGVTMGGGVGISLHGSHPVATDRFVFAMPETAIGFFPDVGVSYLLSRCVGAYGMYLGLTGNRLNAVDANALGLVKGVIPSHEMSAVMEALHAADLFIEASARVDACLAPFYQPTETASIFSLEGVVNACFQADSVESIMSELRQLGDSWALDTLYTLNQHSPTSLKVTHQQIKRAAHLSLEACLKQDYRLARQFMEGHDFYEGVRALLVDKDKSPNWQPPTLEAVTQPIVSSYFIEEEGSR